MLHCHKKDIDKCFEVTYNGGIETKNVAKMNRGDKKCQNQNKENF